MADRAAELRELAEDPPRDVDPETFARTVASHPGDANVIGEALVALESAAATEAIAAVASLLDADDVTVRRGAALALRTSFETHPVPVRGLAGTLAAALSDEDHLVRNHAGVALANLSWAHPSASVAAIGDLPPALDPNRLDLLSSALDVATVAVETDPGAAVPLLDALFDVLLGLAERDDHGPIESIPNELSEAATDYQRQHRTELRRQRGRVVNVIATILVESPEAAASVRNSLADALSDEAVGEHRASLAEVVGHVAEGHPDAVAPAIDPLVGLLDDPDRAVAASAARSLGILAETSGDRVADAVVGRVGALVDLLGAETPRARVASAGLLAYVGEFRPEAVRSATAALLEGLDDGEADVRATAALALGYAGVPEALVPLRELTGDPDERVRATAERAIDRIEDHE